MSTPVNITVNVPTKYIEKHSIEHTTKIMSYYGREFLMSMFSNAGAAGANGAAALMQEYHNAILLTGVGFTEIYKYASAKLDEYNQRKNEYNYILAKVIDPEYTCDLINDIKVRAMELINLKRELDSMKNNLKKYAATNQMTANDLELIEQFIAYVNGAIAL